MKIEQNKSDGKLLYKLDAGEEWSVESHLTALTELVGQQAIETSRHTKEYRKLVGRIDELEALLKKLEEK